jgi:hypothetical protein
VAALVGILRHVEIDRQHPEETRRLSRPDMAKLIVTPLLDLINTTTPPPNRTEDGHEWMRRRAIDILGALGTPGDNGQIVSALDGVLTDGSAPLVVRCAAAEALGKLAYKDKSAISIDPAETAKKLASLAAYAFYTEIQRVEDQYEREQERHGGGSYRGRYFGGYTSTGVGMFGSADARDRDGFNPLGYRVDLTRRRIKNRLVQIRTGLAGSTEKQAGGMLALVKEDNEKRDHVAKAIDGLDAIAERVDQSRVNDVMVLVRQLREDVRRMEDACGIVAHIAQLETDDSEQVALLTDTMDALVDRELHAPPDVPQEDVTDAPIETTPSTPAG